MAERKSAEADPFIALPVAQLMPEDAAQSIAERPDADRGQPDDVQWGSLPVIDKADQQERGEQMRSRSVRDDAGESALFQSRGRQRIKRESRPGRQIKR